MTSLSRTWVRMSYRSVFRTSTITSLSAFRPNSKVLLNSYAQEHSGANSEDHPQSTLISHSIKATESRNYYR